MEVYIFAYSFLILSCFFDRKSIDPRLKKTFLYSNVVIFTIIGGVGNWARYDDWNEYMRVFELASWDNIFSYSKGNNANLEPGYVFVNVLFKEVFGSYTIFMLSCHFFRLFTFAYVVKRYSNYPILIFAIFAIIYVPVLMIRQYIAISFIIWSLDAMWKRKLFRFSVFILLASSFHITALFFFPFYWIGYVPCNFLLINAIYIVFMIFGPLISDNLLGIGSNIGGEIGSRVDIYANKPAVEEKERAIITSLLNIFLLCK